ncbi:hypothetical protein LOZ48_005839, partial [Ophidiomyces ophidiicola]
FAKTVIAVIRCANFKSVYGEEGVEAAFIEAFGNDASMISCSSNGGLRKRILVTATKVGKTPSAAFHNYNDSKAVSDGRSYQLPDDDLNATPLWKIARATSAIPGIFPPAIIGSCKFEDGGMGRHNNPVHVSLTEGRRVLPSGMEPDWVLSLGTGSEDRTEDRHPPARQNMLFNFFHSFFLFSLFQSVMRATNGEATWRERFDQLDTPTEMDHMRFDVTVDGPFEITNVEVMPSLQNTARIQPGISEMAWKSAMDLLTARFYFVLDRPPIPGNKGYKCHAMIRCQGSSQAIALNLV